MPSTSSWRLVGGAFSDHMEPFFELFFKLHFLCLWQLQSRNASVAGFILKWGLLMMCIFFGHLAQLEPVGAIKSGGSKRAKGQKALKGIQMNSKHFLILTFTHTISRYVTRVFGNECRGEGMLRCKWNLTYCFRAFSNSNRPKI